MVGDDASSYESGDLSIFPELGIVRNSRGESARLGPINMKVLACLVSCPGRVVSRTELFESVWKNQVVSDDVLTRCISDIRAQLSQLSAVDGQIETLPKRGYRWTGSVNRLTAPDASALDQRATAGSSTPEPAPRRRVPRVVLSWLGRGLAYAAVLVVIASAAVWLIDRFVPPVHPVIAVLPTQAATSPTELAVSIEEALSTYLLGLDDVDLLSSSAVASGPDNPYPFFYYQFGARWLVESELRTLAGETVLTVELVDARTGIVQFRSSASIAGGEPTTAKLDALFHPLGQFIETRPAR